MSDSSDQNETTGPDLRPAIVLGASEQICTVFTHGERLEMPFAEFFPRPRSERVSPGQLVAVKDGGHDRGGMVVWRWFDAVVLEVSAGQARLWEPSHGEVLAAVRDPHRAPVPGSRAYASAGLEGADWWVAGPAVGRAEDADVELAEVERFLVQHGLWDGTALPPGA